MGCPGAVPRHNRQGAPCPHCAPPRPPRGSPGGTRGAPDPPPVTPPIAAPRPPPPRVAEEGSGTPKAAVPAAPWGPPEPGGPRGSGRPPSPPGPVTPLGARGSSLPAGAGGAGLGSRTPRGGHGIPAGATRDPRRGAGAAAGPRDGRRASDSAVSFLPRLAPAPAAPGPQPGLPRAPPAPPARRRLLHQPGAPGCAPLITPDTGRRPLPRSTRSAPPRPGPGCGTGTRGGCGTGSEVTGSRRTHPCPAEPRARQDGARCGAPVPHGVCGTEPSAPHRTDSAVPVGSAHPPAARARLGSPSVAGPPGPPRKNKVIGVQHLQNCAPLQPRLLPLSSCPSLAQPGTPELLPLPPQSCLPGPS
ncbi:basic proline-rich protein-like [Ammospiza nelsoni]|uniref:basic proline-rich protein-like n=1 Tax=Ammospiza nelsoni TaxID=2857394 RepID=UPI00286B5C88|nr:basic proline-rich protein-like [Ammospiza nelsoni]